MLIRSADAFRDLDRVARLLGDQGTMSRPSVMPMDAWRRDDDVVLEFDLPGVDQNSIDVDIERGVVTVRAGRETRATDTEYLASERPRGVFSRQLVLGDNLDLDRLTATYRGGVLRLEIPIAEKAKPRKVQVTSGDEVGAVETGPPRAAQIA